MAIHLVFPSCGTEIPENDRCWVAGLCHDVVDLRATPSAVDELPDLIQTPRMRHILQLINGEGTIFRTFGYDVDILPGKHSVNRRFIGDDGSERRSELDIDIMHSYIHLGFADYARCFEKDDYYRVIGRLSERLFTARWFHTESNGGEKFTVSFGVRFLRMYGTDMGFNLSITCYVRAKDTEIIQDWSVLMTTIAEFLAEEKL